MSRTEMIKYVQAARPDIQATLLDHMSLQALTGLYQIEQHRINHEISEELVEQF